jgi:hypothetical protein
MVLFEACTSLQRVQLSSRLLKVSDAATFSLAHSCKQLLSFKMTRRMTDASLAALAGGNCPLLEELDCRHCPVGETAVLSLLSHCPNLRRVQLPQLPRLAGLLGGTHWSSVPTEVQVTDGMQQVLSVELSCCG